MFKLVFTGGGTAGHVWPHFAIASELQRSFPALPQAHSTGAQVAEELEFHYLGSAKILGGVGKGLAEAMAELKRFKQAK